MANHKTRTPRLLSIPVTKELREVNAVERLRAIADRAGHKQAAMIRALLLLGIITAERDPAALASVGALAREAV